MPPERPGTRAWDVCADPMYLLCFQVVYKKEKNKKTRSKSKGQNNQLWAFLQFLPTSSIQTSCFRLSSSRCSVVAAGNLTRMATAKQPRLRALLGPDGKLTWAVGGELMALRS